LQALLEALLEPRRKGVLLKRVKGFLPATSQQQVSNAVAGAGNFSAGVADLFWFSLAKYFTRQ
jgi:Na+-transporting NADH:ubiquinone oxidoreductase subunit NqrC